MEHLTQLASNTPLPTALSVIYNSPDPCTQNSLLEHILYTLAILSHSFIKTQRVSTYRIIKPQCSNIQYATHILIPMLTAFSTFNEERF
jgi:hypothetical protein